MMPTMLSRNFFFAHDDIGDEPDLGAGRQHVHEEVVHLHEEVVQVGLHEEFAPVAEIVIEASINAGQK